MLNEYPNLFNPKNNLKSIDYIQAWIQDANNYFINNSTDVSSLKQWRETVDKEYGLERLVDLQAKVDKLDSLEIGEDNILNLSKIATVTDLFEYDVEGNIIKANIIPGEYDPYEGVEIDPGQEGSMEDSVDLLLQELPITFDNTSKIAITTGEYGYLRGAIPFDNTFEKTRCLSSIGEWVELPEVPSTYINKVTREQLLELRHNNELIPGMWYRIIDYNTIVLQENVSSNSMGIDILILATANGILSENVYFIQNGEDNSYIGRDIDVNVSAWRGKYCIDNDNKRFSFLNSHYTFIIASIDNEFIPYVRYEQGDTEYEGTALYCWKKLNKSIYEVKDILDKGGNINTCYDNTTNSTIYTRQEEPSVESTGYSYGYGFSIYAYGIPSSSSVLYNNTDNWIPQAFIKAVFPKSKGAIYYLEDEYGNNAPYDFKSIIFEWPEDDVCGPTFAYYNGSTKSFTDASVLNTHFVYRNTINEYYTYFKDNKNQEYQRLSLNKISMNCPCIDNHYGVNSNNMYILGESKNNRWLGDSCNNKFTQNVIGNYFFTDCEDNIFKINVTGNVFMGNCKNNNFAEPQYEHVTNDGYGRGLLFNNIGSNFSDNISTMPSIVGNTIGNNFKNNKLKGHISDYSNGSVTTSNTLYLNEQYNFVNCIIGNNVTANTFEGVEHSVLGSNFSKNYVKRFSKCTINNQVSYCNFIAPCISLLLEGDNTLIKGNVPINHSTISNGVSYVEIKGNPMFNSTVSSGVLGKENKMKKINVLPSNGQIHFIYNSNTIKEIQV